MSFKDPKINIEDSKVSFDAVGEGARGECEYHFELDLPHDICPKVDSRLVKLIVCLLRILSVRCRKVHSAFLIVILRSTFKRRRMDGGQKLRRRIENRRG